MQNQRDSKIIGINQDALRLIKSLVPYMERWTAPPEKNAVKAIYAGKQLQIQLVQAQLSRQAAIPKPVSNETNKSSPSDTTIGLGISRHCSAGEIRQCLGVFYHVLSWVDFLLFFSGSSSEKKFCHVHLLLSFNYSFWFGSHRHKAKAFFLLSEVLLLRGDKAYQATVPGVCSLQQIRVMPAQCNKRPI